MARVTFHTLGVTVEVADGQTVFDAGLAASAGIETACVGKGTCGLCRVRVLAGEANLVPYTDEELKHLGNVYHLTKVRLSCRAVLRGGDVTVDPAPRRKKLSSRDR